MISSPTPSGNPMQPQSTQRSINWIEGIALPLASSVMEAQPAGLFYLLLSIMFATWPDPVPPAMASFLDPTIGTISILFVGLHWWAMGIERLERSRLEKQCLSFLGLCLGLALGLGLQLLISTNIAFMVPLCLLIGGAWIRGRIYSGQGLDDQWLLRSMKFGFLVQIIVICLLLSLLPASLFSCTLSLVLFFLGGLIALSFQRIGFIRTANAAHTYAGAHSDPTHLWLWVISLLGIGTLLVLLALQGTIIVWLIAVLSALILAGIFLRAQIIRAWQNCRLIGRRLRRLLPLLIILIVVLAVLFSLFSPGEIGKTGQAGKQTNKPGSVPGSSYYIPPASSQQSPDSSAHSSFFIWIALAVFIMACIGLIILIWYLRGKRKKRFPDEHRESISLREFLQTRRSSGALPRAVSIELEALDPDSARARYRSFLQAMAEQGQTLAHRPDETPAEYQARLQRSRLRPPAEPPEPEAEVLNTLTQAYEEERYGGKKTQPPPAERIRAWVTRMTKPPTA